jgi:hypothetical protein
VAPVYEQVLEEQPAGEAAMTQGSCAIVLGYKHTTSVELLLLAVIAVVTIPFTENGEAK